MVAIWPGTGVGGGLILTTGSTRGAGLRRGDRAHHHQGRGAAAGLRGPGAPGVPLQPDGHRQARRLAVRAGEKTALTRKTGKDVTRATSGDLAWAHARGDKVVGKAVDEAARYLALGIASMANLLNPELVVLGRGWWRGWGSASWSRCGPSWPGCP